MLIEILSASRLLLLRRVLPSGENKLPPIFHWIALQGFEDGYPIGCGSFVRQDKHSQLCRRQLLTQRGFQTFYDPFSPFSGYVLVCQSCSYIGAPRIACRIPPKHKRGSSAACFYCGTLGFWVRPCIAFAFFAAASQCWLTFTYWSAKTRRCLLCIRWLRQGTETPATVVSEVRNDRNPVISLSLVP